jgi:diacylglycerol kinase family enzyme
VREVAENLAHTQIPLLIWPQGTENLVAKSLGFRANPALMLHTLLAGTLRHIDLAQANSRMFMVVAGVGFDAEVVQRLARKRTGHITHLHYAVPLWRTFWEHRWPVLSVTGQGPQGRVQWEGPGMVFVGNMARYALGLPVAATAIPDDGLLDLIILPCQGRLELVGHSLRTLCRKHLQHPSAIARRVTTLKVRSRQPVPAQIDGEEAGTAPLDFALQPAALTVKVPPTDARG